MRVYILMVSGGFEFFPEAAFKTREAAEEAKALLESMPTYIVELEVLG